MFHLHSLKEPPPKRMCETSNFTIEVEATISSQESQPPPIQRQVDQSTARGAVEIKITEPFQPTDFNFPKKHCGKQNRAFQSNLFFVFLNFPGYTIMSKAILCCVSFACNKMQNQIFELPEVRKSALFLKGFQTGKRRWRDSRSIKCLNATK